MSQNDVVLGQLVDDGDGPRQNNHDVQISVAVYLA